MFDGQVKILKSYLESNLNRFFPGVKGVVFLIILPACFIVIFYFFSIIVDLVKSGKNWDVIEYEKKFAALKEDLPRYSFVNYINDLEADNLEDFFLVRYVLVPFRIIRGLKTNHPYLLVHYLNKNEIPNFDGYTLKRNYGNGIMLFERSM